MISIIIPVYKVELYLSRCIESVLFQTVSGQELDIIIVDDGSPDNCPQLCDYYASMDSRIRVIHKRNGGLSDARNVGMKIARGEWIFFLDSDDWLMEGSLQKLYDFAISNKCDVVQGGFYYAYSDHMLYRKPNRREREKCVLSREEAMHDLIVNDRVKNFAWGKLYRTEQIRNIDFPVGKYFEDSFWQHIVMNGVKRYGIIDAPLYYYRQREDSISGEASERFCDLIEGYKSRLEFIRKKYPQYEDVMKKMLQHTCEQKYPKHGLWPELCRLVERIYLRFFMRKKYAYVKV